MADSLGELVLASQAGDLEAFGQLVVRFQRMALAVAFAVVGDLHLAEDAAQEAFIEAYQSLPNLREPAAFPAWFRRVVYKRADRLVRGKSLATLPLSAAALVAAEEGDPPRAAEAHELSHMVERALVSLPEPDRALVRLFHMGGYSQREIGAMVALPEQQVKKRLFRARLSLRRSLEELMSEQFEGHEGRAGAFARAVQFFIAVRAGDLAQVGPMLEVEPALIAERERWDEEQSRRSHMPAVGSFTALHRAAYYGDGPLAELLLKRGASPNATTKTGQTPLHVAVLADEPALVECLLRAGADPNAATERGQTPLHWATIRRRAWHIRRLLSAGADTNVPDIDGRTPTDWAALKGLELATPRREAIDAQD